MKQDQHYQAQKKRLFNRVQQTCFRYELLAPGDRILVAVSGGKDSYTMLYFLHMLQKSLPFSFEIIAVHLDQQQPGYDGKPLEQWLRDFGSAFEILSEDTYSVVVSHLEPGATYCALCSRLRRGILYSAAERLGCNKLALGHHRDDALETFMMNLFYAGKMQAMPAAYQTDDQRFTVIRPLIECAESDIARFAEQEQFPILPCNLCGSQDGLKRDKMSVMLKELEQEHPHVRSVMFHALQNVRPTHLLDRDVLEAWQARPADVGKKTTIAIPRKQHARALPIATSEGNTDPEVKAPRKLPMFPTKPEVEFYPDNPDS
jgi:tRNA 2-thiocytidine biosynthesis protein TtcA